MKKLLVLSVLVAIVAPTFAMSANDAITDFDRMLAKKMLEKSQQPKDM